jgi:hypothetical protein
MSHLSTITGVQITNLSAVGTACLIANQQRKLNLQFLIGAGQIIRGWRQTTQHKRYVAAIHCQTLGADIGLAFVPNVDQPADAVPIIEEDVVQNGHFVLEGDLMLLRPLGHNLNLITNLYSATLIQRAIGGQQGDPLQLQLENDNSIVLAN